MAAGSGVFRVGKGAFYLCSCSRRGCRSRPGLCPGPACCRPGRGRACWGAGGRRCAWGPPWRTPGCAAAGGERNHSKKIRKKPHKIKTKRSEKMRAARQGLKKFKTDGFGAVRNASGKQNPPREDGRREMNGSVEQTKRIPENKRLLCVKFHGVSPLNPTASPPQRRAAGPQNRRFRRENRGMGHFSYFYSEFGAPPGRHGGSFLLVLLDGHRSVRKQFLQRSQSSVSFGHLFIGTGSLELLPVHLHLRQGLNNTF